MDKKGVSFTIIIIIGIILILLIASIIVVVYVASKNNEANEKKLQEMQPKITFYMKASDASTQQYEDANYILEHLENGSVVIDSQGKLTSGAYTPVEVPQNNTYHLHCWNDNHYSVKVFLIPSALEKEMNKSKVTCQMPLIGNINVTHSGDLSRELNIITLNVSEVVPNGNFYRTGMCFTWSAGIVDVVPKDLVIECDKGSWINWSTYDGKTMKYTYLPEGQWRCGDEQFEECEAVSNNRCRLKSDVTPKRFQGTTDSCYSAGKSLSSLESFDVTLEVKTLDIKNSLDFIDITLFDADRRYDTTTSQFIWVDELDSQKIGAEDFRYRINYDNEAGK